MGHLQTSRLIPASPGDLFRHIVTLENLPQWLAPTINVELPEPTPILREQSEFEITFERFGRRVHGVFRVDEMKPRERVTYRQIEGLFKTWRHTQLLSVHDPKTTLLTDIVEFQLPYGILGALADDLFARADMERILNDRLQRIEDRFSGPG